MNVTNILKKIVQRHASQRMRIALKRYVLKQGGVKADGKNFLLVTLDSCRYDTYIETPTPTFDKIGKVHRAMAPANFTFPSHMAIFAGFTPGDPTRQEPFINPNAGKFWKVAHVGSRKDQKHLMVLEARNVVDGYNKAGYVTIGTGAMGWFIPEEITSEPLVKDFQHFFHPGNYHSLHKQIDFILDGLQAVTAEGAPFFAFMNVGETHKPYWHQGANWDRLSDVCRPFNPDGSNDAAVCKLRQSACLQYVDQQFERLLNAIDLQNTHVVICADHGDCWGEDGMWGHTITHEKVMEVPLVFRLCTTGSR